MAEIKRRKIVYKVATFLKPTGNPGTTLESLLQLARKKLPKALDRFETPTSSTHERRFINYALVHTGKNGNGSIYGSEFLAFEHGESQSTIKIDPTATEISVAAIQAGKDKEFLAGYVYFGVLGNHVVACQSRGLRVKELEDYLNWFLITKSKVLPDDNRVTLCDHVPKSKKAHFKGVKGIQLTAPVHMHPSAETQKKAEDDNVAAKAAKSALRKQKKAGHPAEEPETKSQFYPVKLAGKAWDAVKSLVGDTFQLPEEIDVDNLSNTPEIEVQIFLRWKGRHFEDDSNFLDGVASNLRHIDDEIDYEVRGSSGTLGKDDIKIFKELNFNWNKEGRPTC
jgi:hypothetical protein